MDIHGFHVVSKLDADSEEGFSTTVTHPDKTQIRGPFPTIKEAVECAHAWVLEDPDAETRIGVHVEKDPIADALANQHAQQPQVSAVKTDEPNFDN